MKDCVAVFDLGKTNIKVVVFDAAGKVVAERGRPNAPLAPDGQWPYLQLDAEGAWAFLIGTLKELGARFSIGAISATTHGCAGVLMGPDGAALCLNAGANDLGGTLMNESISRAAGTQHGQEFPPEAMEALIRSIGRIPLQRDTLYRPASQERRVVSFNAPELAPVVQTPPRKVLAAE